MSVGGVAVARTSYITEITDDVSRPIFSQFGGGLSTLGTIEPALQALDCIDQESASCTFKL